MKYIKIWVILLFVFNAGNIYANNIEIRGKAVKLLDIGKRMKYFNKNGVPISLHIPSLNNKLISNGIIYSKGGFRFKKRVSSSYIGQEVQFKIHRDDWFIISPFNGKFFLPKNSQKINIIIISKYSQLYQELFKVVDYYSIQTFVTSSKRKADLQLRDLQNFCKRNAKKDSFYCKKYVKKIPIINPNRDPLYKIYYNIYNSQDEAKRDLKKIKRLKGLEKSFIVEHTVIDVNFFD